MSIHLILLTIISNPKLNITIFIRGMIAKLLTKNKEITKGDINKPMIIWKVQILTIISWAIFLALKVHPNIFTMISKMK